MCSSAPGASGSMTHMLTSSPLILATSGWTGSKAFTHFPPAALASSIGFLLPFCPLGSSNPCWGSHCLVYTNSLGFTSSWHYPQPKVSGQWQIYAPAPVLRVDNSGREVPKDLPSSHHLQRWPQQHTFGWKILPTIAVNKGCCGHQPLQPPPTVLPEGIQDGEKQDTCPR